MEERNIITIKIKTHDVNFIKLLKDTINEYHIRCEVEIDHKTNLYDRNDISNGNIPIFPPTGGTCQQES